MKKRFALFFIFIFSICLCLSACNKPQTPEIEYAVVSLTQEEAMQKLDALSKSSGYRLEARFDGEISVHAKRGSFIMFDNVSFLRYDDEYKSYVFSNGSWLFDKKMSKEEFDLLYKTLSENFFKKLFTAQSLTKLVALEGELGFDIYTEDTTGDQTEAFLKDKSLKIYVDKEYGLTLKILDGQDILFDAIFEKNYYVPTLPTEHVNVEKEAPTFIKGKSALDKLEGNFDITCRSLEGDLYEVKQIRRVGNDYYINDGEVTKVFVEKDGYFALYVLENDTQSEAFKVSSVELDAELDSVFDVSGAKRYSLSTYLQMCSDFLDGTLYNGANAIYRSTYKGAEKNIAGVVCQSAVYEDFFEKTQYFFDAQSGILFSYTATQNGTEKVLFEVTEFSLDVDELGFTEPQPEVEPEPEPEPVVADVSKEEAEENIRTLLGENIYFEIIYSDGTVKELYYFNVDSLVESATATDGEIVFYRLGDDTFTKITGTSDDYNSQTLEYANRGDYSKSAVTAASSDKRTDMCTLFTTLALEYFDENGELAGGTVKTQKDGYAVYTLIEEVYGEEVKTSYFVNSDGIAVKCVKEASGVESTEFEIFFDTEYRYPFN